MAKLLAAGPQLAFFLTVLIQLVIVLTMAGMAFKLVKENVDLQDPLQQSKYTTLSCYLAVFTVAQVLELVMTLEALRLCDMLQVVVLLLLNPALTALAAVHFSQIKPILIVASLSPWQCYKFFGPAACESYQSLWTQVEPYLIAVPSILFAAWLSMLFWATQLRFSWETLKAAESRIRNTQRAVYMLKISSFCFIGVVSQLLIAKVPTDTIDFGLAIASVPVAFIVLLILTFALNQDWKWLIVMSRLLMLGATGYLGKSNEDYNVLLAADEPIAYVISRIFNPNIQAWYLKINQVNVTFFIAVSLFALLVISVYLLVPNLRSVLAWVLEKWKNKKRGSRARGLGPEEGNKETSALPTETGQ